MAATKIAFDLVSPERLLLSVQADMVTVPGLMRVSSGMCSGRMPSSPASPGAMTRCASPE